MDVTFDNFQKIRSHVGKNAFTSSTRRHLAFRQFKLSGCSEMEINIDWKILFVQLEHLYKNIGYRIA